jgi:hypothetical protein
MVKLRLSAEWKTLGTKTAIEVPEEEEEEEEEEDLEDY